MLFYNNKNVFLMNCIPPNGDKFIEKEFSAI